MFGLRVSELGDGRNHLPGHPEAARPLVSGDWAVTSQKHGVSAIGLQRKLGLGSYDTVWTWLHKLRRAMVRPGRDRLSGVVEVDETYWGSEEENARGRQTENKALIVIAAQEDGEPYRVHSYAPHPRCFCREPHAVH
jgi:hypothetical protein